MVLSSKLLSAEIEVLSIPYLRDRPLNFGIIQMNGEGSEISPLMSSRYVLMSIHHLCRLQLALRAD